MPWPAKNAEGALDEAGHGQRELVAVQLDVGQARVVVDHRVGVVVADAGLGTHPGSVALRAVLGDGVPGPAEARVARDVHVQQVAGTGPLVAVGGFARRPRGARERVAAQHLPYRLMRYADGAGHQPRSPAGQLAGVADPLLELGGKPTRALPRSARTVTQAHQRAALLAATLRASAAPRPTPWTSRRCTMPPLAAASRRPRRAVPARSGHAA